MAINIGLIIIGDEILSGKHTDQHFQKMIAILANRGLQLSWAEYIGDDRARITQTLRRTFASGDIVFSCGGIGATPDDHTRQCAAAALGVSLLLHPEAAIKIRERMVDLACEAGSDPDFDAPQNLHRLKMGEFPDGAKIIPNPFNKIPGFSVRTHYFVPGFPVMAWPMIEWALDTYHADLFHKIARLEKSVWVLGSTESMLAPLMDDIETAFPSVKIFSLPTINNPQLGSYIDLGVKGDPAQTMAAFNQLLNGLDELRVKYQLKA